MAHELVVIRDGRRFIEVQKTKAAFLRLCCTELTYSQIATKMGKSRRTINGYRDQLFLLLTVRTRTGLVLWCFKSGYVKPKDIHLEYRAKKKRR